MSIGKHFSPSRLGLVASWRTKKQRNKECPGGGYVRGARAPYCLYHFRLIILPVFTLRVFAPALRDGPCLPAAKGCAALGLLFAFWLRSSVVPVLISLIADSPALQDTPINLIFRTRDLASVLAYASLHCVTGLILLPVDANPLFVHQLFGLSGYLEKEVWFGSTTMESIYLSYRYAIQLYHPPTKLSH
ncbi:hypothetical protein N7455_012502, partial [Penicillium solitum]|uniref:uncharacterized protein n=1 Tax=Penicillium solitum TaxID=60172 RepID=UPI0032C46C65